MTYTRISPNELDCDCLAGCERRPCRHVDYLVSEFMADTRAVEDDSSLLLNDEQSLVSAVVFCLRKQKQNVRAMILHLTLGREELDRTEAQPQSSHRRPGRTPDRNIC